MEKITKFDLNAAFKALDEIESPVIEKSEKAKRLVEEVKRVPTVDALVEEYYDINNQADLEDAKEERDEEIAKAKLAKIEKIVDLDAESPEDLEPSYEGKTIIQCPQCMTMFYKDPADVVISEDDPSLCNVGEKCQHCGNDDGYTIIGKVAPVEPEEAEKFEGSEEENELNLDFEDKSVETAKTPAGKEAPELASAEETENSEETKESFTSKVADALLEDFDEEDSEESGVEESVNNSDIQKEAEANSELATENESENKTINEELSDKELDKKLRYHNNFIEYVRAQIKQDEEALKKAGDNEEIKAAIQRRLDAHKEDLEKALPAAIKVEKAIEELPTPEEIKNESVNNKESLKEYFDDPDYWSDKMGPSYLISYNGKPVCYIEYPYAGELGYGGEAPSKEEILFRAKEVLNNSIDREKLDLADNATELDDSKISYEYEDDVDYVDVPVIEVAYGFKEGLKEDASLGTLESLNKSEVQKDAAKHSKLETENHSKNLTLNESSVEAELNKFMAGLEEACKDCEESGVELNESPVEEKKLDEFEAEVNATTAADESLKEGIYDIPDSEFKELGVDDDNWDNGAFRPGWAVEIINDVPAANISFHKDAKTAYAKYFAIKNGIDNGDAPLSWDTVRLWKLGKTDNEDKLLKEYDGLVESLKEGIDDELKIEIKGEDNYFSEEKINELLKKLNDVFKKHGIDANVRVEKTDESLKEDLVIDNFVSELNKYTEALEEGHGLKEIKRETILAVLYAILGGANIAGAVTGEIPALSSIVGGLATGIAALKIRAIALALKNKKAVLDGHEAVKELLKTNNEFKKLIYDLIDEVSVEKAAEIVAAIEKVIKENPNIEIKDIKKLTDKGLKEGIDDELKIEIKGNDDYFSEEKINELLKKLNDVFKKHGIDANVRVEKTDESLKEELPSDVTAAANEVINKLDALNDKAEAEIKEESGVEEGLEEAAKEEPKFDFELPKATNAEFKKMINSKTFKEFGEEINGPEASFDLLEEVDEKSFNENITKFLTAVYENVDTFETKGCSLKENKLIVEGKINFKSGNTNETVFEFVVAKSPKAFPILEGYNKTFAEGKIFTVDCIGEDGGKRLLVDHISYKYNIGKNLIEGLTK